MKSLLIIFGAMLLIIALPVMFGSVDDARVESLTQNYAGVTTGAGSYSASVVLGSDLYNDVVGNVSSVSSNLTSDSPSADNYTAVSNALSVGGLEQSSTRTLSVTYNIASTSLETGMSTFLTIIMWFVILVEIGMWAGAVYAFFR